MKHLLLIYNPNAGRQKIKGSLSDILEVFSDRGWLTSVYPTRAAGDATKIAASLSASYERVVCCGGDGTLNETVTGLMKIPESLRPVLGYIPTGTTNDFARNLSLPKSFPEMAEIACGGVPRACDLGRVNDRWFTYVAAFGLFTDVSYATPQISKNLLGHLAYVLEGASRLTNIKSYRLKVETPTTSIVDDFIYGMVGNTVSVGGLMNLPSDEVKLDDGSFEVLLVRTPRSAADFQSIIHALSAMTNQGIPHEGLVEGFSASTVTFTCVGETEETSSDPLPWTLDGEFGGEHSSLTIQNVQKAFVLACGK